MVFSLILALVTEGADVENFFPMSTEYSTNPASGNSYHLTQEWDQFGAWMGGSWKPQAPPTHAFYEAAMYATGLGSVEFTFSEGSSHVLKVGDWGKRWYTLNYVPWYQTEENKRVSWFQRVVFPCYRVNAGERAGDPDASVNTGVVYLGTPHEKNVTSTIVPKPAILEEQDSSFQLSLSKTPVSVRFGGNWREGSRTPIIKQIDAEWTVTSSDTYVITCMHTNCTKIVPTAEHHFVSCLLDDGMYKGCGDPYWLCQPEASLHKFWPCVICGHSMKPCTPEGHEEWVQGPCPVTFIVNGKTVSCNADPRGHWKCIHIHNFPYNSGSGSN